MAAQPVVAEHDEAHQHVAGVRDARVREQALDVRLRQRREIAERHGHHAEHQDQLRPVDAAQHRQRRVAVGATRRVEEAEQQGEAGGLRADREERGHRIGAPV